MVVVFKDFVTRKTVINFATTSSVRRCAPNLSSHQQVHTAKIYLDVIYASLKKDTLGCARNSLPPSS